MSARGESTRVWLLAVLLLSTAVRAAFAFRYFGFSTGDDLEILQAGFRQALGWPYQPWEIRNLLLPQLVVAPAIRLGAAFGVQATGLLAAFASLPFVLLASFNVLLVYRLAHRWLEAESQALGAATLYAFHWLPLGYGSTVYPRTASTCCLLLAMAVVWKRPGRSLRPLVAGLLLALAWAIRYSEAVFLLPLLATVALEQRRSRDRLLAVSSLVAGFVAGSLVTVGLADWLAWGKPFASLIAFARFTLVERLSSSLERAQPAYWYLWRLAKWLPLTLLPLLGFARRRSGWLVPALWLLLPLAALSAIHHKELRYLQGIMPWLMLLAAAGAGALWVRGRRRTVGALLALSVLLGLSGLGFLGKKSMAAVVAAREMRSRLDSGTVCLSQAWAYGGTLYLNAGGESAFEVKELGYPLGANELARGLASCRVVALYRQDLEREPSLGEALTRRGFERRSEHRWGASKAVVVFERAPASF
ncbi:MAG: hypothetical protein U0002_20270 [Thermoanaerobaculia bacterium]